MDLLSNLSTTIEGVVYSECLPGYIMPHILLYALIRFQRLQVKPQTPLNQ